MHLTMNINVLVLELLLFFRKSSLDSQPWSQVPRNLNCRLSQTQNHSGCHLTPETSQTMQREQLDSQTKSAAKQAAWLAFWNLQFWAAV